MPSDDVPWLEDIDEAIAQIEGFVAGMDFAAFVADARTRHAVVYGLLAISEASRRLSDEFKARHPDSPWSDVAAAGNVYRHEYHRLNEAMVWKTVKEGLPAMRTSVRAALEAERVAGKRGPRGLGAGIGRSRRKRARSRRGARKRGE